MLRPLTSAFISFAKPPCKPFNETDRTFPTESTRCAVADNEVFLVSRKITGRLGWALVFAGSVCLLLFLSDLSIAPLIASLVLIALGVKQILSSRNVNKIVVGNSSITFLPVGAELHFSEIERMIVPVWADRADTPPNALSLLVFHTNTETLRYVPGALAQWKHRARINFHGCDGTRMLKALRGRVSARSGAK